MGAYLPERILSTSSRLREEHAARESARGRAGSCGVRIERIESDRFLPGAWGGVEHSWPVPEPTGTASGSWQQCTVGRGGIRPGAGTHCRKRQCVGGSAAERPANRSGARVRYGCTGAVGTRAGGGLSMFGWGGATRIYLAAGATDMRKGFEGLYGMARDRLLCDPLSGHVFLFANAQRNRLKLLFWDGSGLWVCAKRLEKGRFRWPQATGEETKVVLSHEELTLLLGGIVLPEQLSGTPHTSIHIL